MAAVLAKALFRTILQPADIAGQVFEFASAAHIPQVFAFQPAYRRRQVAGLAETAGVRSGIQPIHHRSRVADLLAAAVVWVLLQPVHGRSRFANVARAAIVWARV